MEKSSIQLLSASPSTRFSINKLSSFVRLKMEGNASVEVEEVEENQHWLQFRSVIEQVRRGKVLNILQRKKRILAIYVNEISQKILSDFIAS